MLIKAGSTEISKLKITEHRITRDRQMEDRQTDRQTDMLRQDFLSGKQIDLYKKTNTSIVKNHTLKSTVYIHCL